MRATACTTPRRPSGHRLLRTLRELGVDLAAVRRVLDGAEGIGEVAARHAAALDAQIRDLRLQRGVLRAIAQEPDDPKEIEKMHELANLTAAERRLLIEEFVAEAFDGLPDEAGVRARMEAAPPDLPENPTAEQIDAWIELARLVADPDFRARVREMAERGADPGSRDGRPPRPDAIPAWEWFAAALRAHPTPTN